MLHDSRQFIAFHFPAVGSLLTDNQKKLAGPLVDPFIAHGMLARTAGVASGSETDPLIALEGEAQSMGTRRGPICRGQLTVCECYIQRNNSLRLIPRQWEAFSLRTKNVWPDPWNINIISLRKAC